MTKRVSREQRVADAFVAVADTLTDEFDIIDLLHTLVDVCVDLLNVDAGCLVLADATGNLQLVASSSEKAQLVEIIQLSAGSGPCVDCYRGGAAVMVDDIAVNGDSWPVFQAAASEHGFRAVFATPMRLRGQVLGALNLFSVRPGNPSAQDALIAQALADIATIGILQERSIRETHVLNEQLQRALESRVLIEQAKGVVAAVGGLDMDKSFAALRNYARGQNLALRDVALQVTSRALDDVLEVILKPEMLNDSVPKRSALKVAPRSTPKS